MSQDKSESIKKVDLNPQINAQDNDELKTMFAQFLIASNEDRISTSKEFAELRTTIASLTTVPSPVYLESPIPDRSSTNRRSSMFFGTPDIKGYEAKNTIQVLQADVVYDQLLKVSSLEGLQFFAKHYQLYTSKYPNREIKTAHMVAYPLRPHVIASWNSYCYKESIITGIELKEVMVEDWLLLSNIQVQEILVESARPRTRELYSRELVLFLGKGIPQTPAVNTENFSQLFYAPFMKSLNDLLHLHDLLSEETSHYSTNKAKMPSPTYGTRDSPGQIALWIISLGSQKEAVLQWLGKDELVKHKTLESGVKYIRMKLMEGRLHSESRQDFDSKLTPVRYEDIRHTQGESFTRQQSSFNAKPQSKFPSRMPYSKDTRMPTSFSALTDTSRRSLCDEVDFNEHFDDEYSTNEEDTDDVDPDAEYSTYTSSQPHDETLLSTIQQTSAPNAIASTFRGYCSELFVFGKCSRRDTSCSLDHSSAGQERCIQSFTFLAKRELIQHGQLPPFNIASKQDKPTSHFKSGFPSTNQDSRIPRFSGYPTRTSSFK
jgi:hypothetical protein